MSQQETKDMAKHFYRASAADFMKIPGSPVAYWATADIISVFSEFDTLDAYSDIRTGMQTGDNESFLRLWPEVSYNVINTPNSHLGSKKWHLYSKGGDFRRWYGNVEHVVNWEDDGYAIKNVKVNGTLRSRVRSITNYKRKGASWSFVSSAHFGCRYKPPGVFFDVAGSCALEKEISIEIVLGLLCSKLSTVFLKSLNPTLNFQVQDIANLPFKKIDCEKTVAEIVAISKGDWDSYEASPNFTQLPLLASRFYQRKLVDNYIDISASMYSTIKTMQRLEEENNRIFIDAYGLQNELTSDVPLKEITLTCNPHYRYGGNRSEDELETLLQCDTTKELVSYAIGCMMGRYSLDEPGLILASQGETLQNYLDQIPSPRFDPDENAILPLTDQEWFPDDATNRFREFVRVVWGDEHLQENLDFVAESLCLHAIKTKRGESALDTIRRYLSTQFYKDHLRTYKKRPIYWLFSSGKQKAFECLVYLHRYNESTLARMRTEYVIPLSAKLNAYAEKLEQDKDASTSTAETKRLEKEIATLHKQQTELAEFDEKLRHYADQRISLDLDDGVKVNYGKFGDLLAEVKAVTEQKPQ